MTEEGSHPSVCIFDSIPAAQGGIGVTSGSGWSARRDDREVDVLVDRNEHGDSPVTTITPRTHPLPAAEWIDGARCALAVVPGIAPCGPRTEWLRIALPPGTVRLRVASALPTRAFHDSIELDRDEDGFRLPTAAPPGTNLLVAFAADDGRRGGALVDGPVEVEVTEAEMPLGPWNAMGLRNLGGLVRYRTTVDLDALDPDLQYVLDLGEIHGTAEVVVNGSSVARLVWGPWRTEVTGVLVAGTNTVEIVVRGTLGGYLADSSPTLFAFQSQIASGLYGPVRLLAHPPSA